MADIVDNSNSSKMENAEMNVEATIAVDETIANNNLPVSDLNFNKVHTLCYNDSDGNESPTLVAKTSIDGTTGSTSTEINKQTIENATKPQLSIDDTERGTETSNIKLNSIGNNSTDNHVKTLDTNKNNIAENSANSEALKVTISALAATDLTNRQVEGKERTALSLKEDSTVLNEATVTVEQMPCNNNNTNENTNLSNGSNDVCSNITTNTKENNPELNNTVISDETFQKSTIKEQTKAIVDEETTIAKETSSSIDLHKTVSMTLDDYLESIHSNSIAITETESTDKAKPVTRKPTKSENVLALYEEKMQLERQREMARVRISQVTRASSQNLAQLQKKLGKCVDKSKHYYSLTERIVKTKEDAQRAAEDYHAVHCCYLATAASLDQAHAAGTHHDDGIEVDVDETTGTVSKEWMARAETKIKEAQEQLAVAKEEHEEIASYYQQLQELQKIEEKRFRNAIEKAKPYYDCKLGFDLQVKAEEKIMQQTNNRQSEIDATLKFGIN